MKVTLLTLGCRVNQSESSILEGTLKASGATMVSLKDNPDYCVVNTCSVTSKSDYNSRQLLRRAAKTGAKVIVTGCYSQLRPEVVSSIPGVTDVIDIKKKYEIIKLITGTQSDLVFGSHSRSRPYLKVQDGCNLRCSYCIVPLARGNSRSLPLDEVVRRAQAIEGGGYHEVVLTGIHLGTYGHDLEERISIAILLKKLLLKTTTLRIRLSSLEINEVDDALMELLQEDRVCKHLHLPLQSGSEKILRLMRRCYSARDFTRRVHSVASRIDNIALGTDVICGFPGESEYEFMETYKLLAGAPFSYLHTFPFSPRPDTQAANMSGRVSNGVMSERIGRLKELHATLKRRYMIGQIGRSFDVILEEEIDEITAVGTSDNYLKIACLRGEHGKGSRIDVKADRVRGGILEGVVIRKS
jgi:threonylcarbamoyladenosine tRNA methylthiotransferase MtaB